MIASENAVKMNLITNLTSIFIRHIENAKECSQTPCDYCKFVVNCICKPIQNHVNIGVRAQMLKVIYDPNIIRFTVVYTKQ